MRLDVNIDPTSLKMYDQEMEGIMITLFYNSISFTGKRGQAFYQWHAPMLVLYI